MQSARKFTKGFVARVCRGEQGVILIAVLTLMVTLILVGATTYIVSSSNAKVAANYKTSQTALQVAMAGAEKAREALRQENLSSSNLMSFSDELNSSTRKGQNNTLDGYGVDDVAIASGTLNNFSYVAYLTNDSVDGFSSTTDSNKKVLITSVATGPNNSKAKVEIVVTFGTPPLSPATIYSKGDVTGNGSSLTVSGNDECNVATAMAPIYTYHTDANPATTNLSGHPTLSGTPSTPQQGTNNIDISSYINQLKGGANYTLTEDPPQGNDQTNYGSSSNYVTVYTNTSSPNNVNGLNLNNVTGYGTLLVDGDLVLGGGFEWHGPILVTGSITLNGGGHDINIHGQIYSGTSTLTDVTINGHNTITYNSCEVLKSAATAPLQTVNWRQP